MVTIQNAFCVSCGACAKVCEEGALTMERMDTEELIVPDEVTERIRAQKAKAKAEAQK